MRAIRAIIIISIIQLWISGAKSQERFVGKVVDSKTQEPLELAVISSARNKNILSDRNGNFIINRINKGDSISISFIGYRLKKIVVSQTNKPVTVLLDKGLLDLKEIVITTHSNNLTTSRTLSLLDLNVQPVKSAQDLLRLVPGLFIAQHQGGGKAEQIFLRGFDADHGTDVNVSVDGIPVNLVSQAHGQGYADLHFLIPETVAGYDFGKGPYYTNKGDFCTAGYVEYNTRNVLDNNLIKLEAGQFNTIRGVAMINLLSGNAKLKGQNAYLASEALYTNGGPFDVPEHFNRFNLLGKFNTKIGSSNKLMLSLSSLTSRWRAAGEIPNRAQAEGYIKDPFGSIDSSQRGYTSRANATVKLTSDLGNNLIWENQAFYSHCYFDLISNFTFFYVNPITGDEFDQHEVRDLYGYNSKLLRRNIFGNATLVSTAGAGFRYDLTHPSSLSHTEHGNFLNFLQRGNVNELNANGYLDETVESGKWLLNAGARIDYFSFYYLNSAPSSDTSAVIYHGLNTTKNKTIFSPKINVQYTVNSSTQLYLKTGKGFHSNDARVVIANSGNGILPAAYGADIGINWKPAPRLFINTAIWYLFLQQEFVYGADYGDESVEPGGRTVRKGIDFSGRYQINEWLFANMNVDLAKPRTIDAAKGKDYIALAPGFTSTAGLLFNFKKGFNGGISYRYMHNRPADDNYSLIAKGYFVADLNANYTTKKYEIGLGIENLFNQSWNEAQFEYVSRLKYETAAVDEISNTPGLPFFARLKFSIFF